MGQTIDDATSGWPVPKQLCRRAQTSMVASSPVGRLVRAVAQNCVPLRTPPARATVFSPISVELKVAQAVPCLGTVADRLRNSECERVADGHGRDVNEGCA
jgi:hypothetical protein